MKQWGSDKIHSKLEELYSPRKRNVSDRFIKHIHGSILFFPLFFANPSDCRQKAILLCSWSKYLVGVSGCAAAVRCLLWTVCSVLGRAARCSGAGGCGCLSAGSPLLACKGRVQAGFVGSVSTSWWVAMQKVVVSAKKGELLYMQYFALAPVLLPVSDQAWRNSTSISA